MEIHMIDTQTQDKLKELSREGKWDELRLALRSYLAHGARPDDVSFDAVINAVMAKVQLEGQLLDPMFDYMDDLVDQLHELDDLEAQVDEVLKTEEVRQKLTDL